MLALILLLGAHGAYAQTDLPTQPVLQAQAEQQRQGESAPAAVASKRADGTRSAARAVNSCVLRVVRDAPFDLEVGRVRDECEQEVAASQTEAAPTRRSLLRERLQREQRTQLVRSVLTPHKRNYLLPISYVFEPNDGPFERDRGEGIDGDGLRNFEATFQISLKVPLVENLLLDEDSLHIGFTTVSFWQAYSSSISAPFRETNYEPEIFWSAPLRWTPFGVDATALQLGLSHQSNGRSGTLSRSWNRLYANFVLERDRLVFSFKPWWRIPEDPKSSPEDSSGDDNPDIERYMGSFEFTTVYRRDDHELSLLIRNNLRENNKGALRLDWTFPLWRNIRGYAQYFNGFGESLIDYDVRTQRIGVGILLSDLL